LSLCGSERGDVVALAAAARAAHDHVLAHDEPYLLVVVFPPEALVHAFHVLLLLALCSKRSAAIDAEELGRSLEANDPEVVTADVDRKDSAGDVKWLRFESSLQEEEARE